MSDNSYYFITDRIHWEERVMRRDRNMRILRMVLHLVAASLSLGTKREGTLLVTDRRGIRTVGGTGHCPSQVLNRQTVRSRVPKRGRVNLEKVLLAGDPVHDHRMEA